MTNTTADAKIIRMKNLHVLLLLAGLLSVPGLSQALDESLPALPDVSLIEFDFAEYKMVLSGHTEPAWLLPAQSTQPVGLPWERQRWRCATIAVIAPKGHGAWSTRSHKPIFAVACPHRPRDLLI